jgi:hypothetical protein
MKKPNNKTTRVVEDRKLIAGMQKHLAGGSLVLAGKTFTAAEVVGFLQERIDVAGPVETAHAAWMSMIDVEKAKIAETQTYVAALRHVLKGMFATNVATLADFGIAPPRTRATLTPDEAALKAARNKATRAARHTASPKQKAKIKGVVPTPPSPIQPTATSPAAPAAVTKPDAGNGASHV